MQYERKICKIYEERFIVEKQNLRILIFFTGVSSFECALSKEGSFKCVQNACRGREGVKKGQKTACALYVWPQMRPLERIYTPTFSAYVTANKLPVFYAL